ncbi:hypothetical protein ACM66B_000517 [Microbotryomycetes sp. NB124-2]
MFYNAEMLTKRGPLARVWMASHLSSKISKTNLLSHSIPSSVSSILGESLLPMALRLSGQLLLGVARIYSRKAKYLLDDCSETLSKVKKAFKPGAVDLNEPENNSRGGAAITLGVQEGGLEDILNQFNYDDNQWELPPAGTVVAANSNNIKAKKTNVSAAADISLPENNFGGWGMNDDFGAMDLDLGFDGGIGTQDMFDADFELGILDDQGGLLDDVEAPRGAKRSRDVDDEGERDEDMSVELGRDVASVHASDRMSNVGLQQDYDDLGGMDFQEHLNYDDGPLNIPDDLRFLGRDKTPPAASINGSIVAGSNVDLTPKTAADLAKAKKQPKAKKARKQVIDSVIELDWEAGRNKVARFKDPSFLPCSRLHMQLLEFDSDPSQYLPRVVSNSTEQFAPAGLASTLQDLYTQPTRRQLIRAQKREAKGGKQQGQQNGDMDVELGRERQASVAPLPDYDDDVNREFGGEGYMGDDLGGEQLPIDYGDGAFQFNLDDDAVAGVAATESAAAATPKASPRKKAKTTSQGGAGSDYVFDEDARAGVSEGPLAVFDGVSSFGGATQSGFGGGEHNTATQSLAATEEDEVINGITGGAGKIKWSKNTIRAIDVLKDELTNDDDDQEVPAPRKRTMQFDTVAEKATRHAASAFFFELLVLGTRECVRIDQDESYGEINVQAKDRLWEVVDGLQTRGLVGQSQA